MPTADVRAETVIPFVVVKLYPYDRDTSDVNFAGIDVEIEMVFAVDKPVEMVALESLPYDVVVADVGFAAVDEE